MSLPLRLLEAYERAQYVVFGEPAITMKVGEPNPGIDALLDLDGARSAAYITPANPRGELRDHEENLIALEMLHESLRDSPYTCYPGEGRDPGGEWVAEPSLLVVGMPLAAAEELGRELEQNAIVFVEKARAPRLIVL
jgi:hypothetical protein